ncbi:hypothetical protein Q9L58_010145 [Maublancomyces gigas]|uniref:Uncharacterized protein n=1 Tax=Discina gigas TaxID=1032678 RepID=A0ABR3G5Y1_9PEZI
MIHSYFLENPPAEWDIIEFCKLQQLQSSPDDFEYNKTLNSWTSSLDHLKHDADPEIALAANIKSENFSINTKKRLSDKMVVKNWMQQEKTKKRKGQPLVKNAPTKQIMNTFHLHGGVNSVVAGFTGGVVNISAAPPGHDGLPNPVVSDKKKISPKDLTIHFHDTRRSLGHLHDNMVDKLSLVSGGFLEDIMVGYTMSLDKLSLGHFCIVDDKTLDNILATQPTAGGTKATKEEVLAGLIQYPKFPAELTESIKRYKGVKTTAECRKIARDSEDNADVHWIDDVFRHIMELLTECNGLLGCGSNLNEGVWDSLVYPPLWDKYFARIPSVFLQRKEISLVALAPYEGIPGNPPHYDGVVQSRALPRIEYAVFEMSRRDTNGRKREVDRDKLIAGCRAMLHALLVAVDYDVESMKKLVVVGVLQGGLGTQLLFMSCISRNVFYLREGACRKLPSDVESMTAVHDVLMNVWLAKWAVENTIGVVERYMEKKKLLEEEEREVLRGKEGYM